MRAVLSDISFTITSAKQCLWKHTLLLDTNNMQSLSKFRNGRFSAHSASGSPCPHPRGAQHPRQGWLLPNPTRGLAITARLSTRVYLKTADTGDRRLLRWFGLPTALHRVLSRHPGSCGQEPPPHWWSALQPCPPPQPSPLDGREAPTPGCGLSRGCGGAGSADDPRPAGRLRRAQRASLAGQRPPRPRCTRCSRPVPRGFPRSLLQAFGGQKTHWVSLFLYWRGFLKLRELSCTVRNALPFLFVS